MYSCNAPIHQPMNDHFKEFGNADFTMSHANNDYVPNYSDVSYSSNQMPMRTPSYSYQKHYSYPGWSCQEPSGYDQTSYNAFYSDVRNVSLLNDNCVFPAAPKLPTHDRPPPYSSVTPPTQHASIHSLQSIRPVPSTPTNHIPHARPKISTSLWDDEDTLCFQIDINGICVTRRQDNDMINGTKLLNVTGMSRGKRDGILKNEKGRVVMKLGAMHLKGVWVTFSRAKLLATHFNIADKLYPLFEDDPAIHFFSDPLSQNYYYYIQYEAYFPKNRNLMDKDDDKVDNANDNSRSQYMAKPMNTFINNQLSINYSPVFSAVDNNHSPITHHSSPHSLYQQDISRSIPSVQTMMPYQTPIYTYKQLPTPPPNDYFHYGSL